MSGARGVERIETVVIGGGQAGLSVGYHLARRGRPFVILEAHRRVGDVWRERWDSLRLFTPAKFDALDGMPFPADPDAFPTKDEMGDYLEAYAARFELPVRTDTRVERVSRRGGRLRVQTVGGGEIEADHVVVAMATYQKPWVPAFAAGLDPAIRQIHSKDYRNPAQLRPGSALVVGAGNSGAEIAKELAADGRRTWIAGRDVGQIPFRVDGPVGRLLAVRLVLRGLFHRVLTVDTPMGRKVRPKFLSQGGPLIRTKSKHLAAAGVERLPRVEGVRGGLPELADGRVVQPDNVVWCTGFRPGFASWIDLPVHGEREPDHERGIVPSVPGLYFVGLHFQYSLSSTMIHGVGRDAERIAGEVAARARSVSGTRLEASGAAA